jgi:hypothetical protein
LVSIGDSGESFSGTIAPSMRSSGGEPVVMCMSLAPFSIMRAEQLMQIDLQALFDAVHSLSNIPERPEWCACSNRDPRHPAHPGVWHTGTTDRRGRHAGLANKCRKQRDFVYGSASGHLAQNLL